MAGISRILKQQSLYFPAAPPPHSSGPRFAKRLFAISPGLGGGQAIRMAMQLFDQRFSRESPAVIPIEMESEIAGFQQLCHEYGISCCVLEETSGEPADTSRE